MKKNLSILFFTLAIILGFVSVMVLIKGGDLGSLLEGIVFLIYILPPVILISSFVYGIFRGFNLLLPLITATVAVLFMLYLNQNIDINIEFFYIPLLSAAIAILGNALGRIFYKKK